MEKMNGVFTSGWANLPEGSLQHEPGNLENQHTERSLRIRV